jgi:hypothetical protein
MGGIALAFLLGFTAGQNLKDAVGLCLGVVLILVVLMRPLLGALGLVALVPALSGIIPGVPVHNLRISELLIGVIGITLLVAARRWQAVRWGLLEWLLLAYGVLWAIDGVLGSVVGHEHLSASDWGTVIGQLQFFVLYRSVKITLRTKSERRLALKVLLIASGAVACLAVLQEIRVPYISHFTATLTGTPSGSSSSDGILRATGPFANWAALAGYLMPPLLVAICLGLTGAVQRHMKAFFFLVVLLTIAVFFTVELSVIACLIIGVAILSRRHARGTPIMRWLGIGAVVVAVIGGALVVQRLADQLTPTAGLSRPAAVPQTINTRWSVWTEQYIPAIDNQPLSGYGVVLPGSIRWPYPESQYIALLIDGGLPLLALFGFLAWAMVIESKKAARSRDPVDRAMGEALVIAVISMAIVNVIWPFTSNGGMPQVLWCLLALLPSAAAVPQSKSASLVGVGVGS